MERFEAGAIVALVGFFLLISPALAGRAASLVIAQIDTPGAVPATPTPTTPTPAAPSQPPTEAATAGSPTRAPAKKSALSAPACSIRYLEAKVAGKLNGRKWTDFRRDECGASETTAVFPNAIAPKYSGEQDLEKARKMTCADQFTANKATNANGGLKWIEKDGGYYAECVGHLRG